MRIRFLLGPAGSGKTFRCLAEARANLKASPAGLPLLLMAPKQSTYQLERQLLEDESVPGYTRLQILSFERLAYYIFDRLRQPPPEMLDEEGRVMVLRGLLARKAERLRLFRASARLNGFALQLSRLLRDFQSNQLTPESLLELASATTDSALSAKLADLAGLFRDYLDWLTAHQLHDADCLLTAATQALRQAGERQSAPREVPTPARPRRESPRHYATPAREEAPQGPTPLWFEQVWADGFLEWSLQEQELLAELMPLCGEATLTFCLDRLEKERRGELSSWSAVRRSFERSKERLTRIAGSHCEFEVLPRRPEQNRFGDNPMLRHLEECWADPRPYTNLLQCGTAGEFPPAQEAIRIVSCPDPVAEATLTAREIARFVRRSGRYRDVMVLVRSLENYHGPLERVFARYEIPFFLDRRESVTHHPLAELTRSALRTIVFDWPPDDWFAALKTGLVPADDAEIDQLENEALARGWMGRRVWQNPIILPEEPELAEKVGKLLDRLVPPFQRLERTLVAAENRPTGAALASALKSLWGDLEVERRLEDWADSEAPVQDSRAAASTHLTVWQQMNSWIRNVELAFPEEQLSLREWLPILDAGLSNLTVGVIPPALDQVLIGAIDRSRNPDIRLAFVLGMNEGVFPAPPDLPALLTDSERAELESRDIVVGSAGRRHLARERHRGYVACTRARERLIITYALRDISGAQLNPSPFLWHLSRLFPSLQREQFPRAPNWRDSEHTNELVGPLLKMRRANLLDPPSEKPSGDPDDQARPALAHRGSGLSDPDEPPGNSPRPERNRLAGEVWDRLKRVPALASVLERLDHFQASEVESALAPELTQRLYGPVLRTSVSRLEQFAACPFKFFVHSGLRAEERERFELDRREQGSFQHDVLALFHEELCRERKRWRDVSPQEARARMKRIAEGFLGGFRDGLLDTSDRSRFTASVLTESLQDFVEVLVAWMRNQYRFDPVKVELPFGENEDAPAWRIPVPGGTLEIYGRIDRVDICAKPGSQQAACVVLDYKSSPKQLDPVLLANGLQLQLLTYLNVIRNWPAPEKTFGVSHLIPVGVFYVNLRGRYSLEQNRSVALDDWERARKSAYQHMGRFDLGALRHLDARADANRGDQFNYRLSNGGEIYRNSAEALSSPDFEALLETVQTNIRRMGGEIFSGVAAVAPFRKSGATACDQCEYQAICRIDPWTHRFRVIKLQ